MPSVEGVVLLVVRTAVAPFLVSFLAGLAAWDRPALAQPLRENEEVYRLVYFGADSGEERFLIAQDPSGATLRVTAQAKVTIGGRLFRLTQELRVGADDLTVEDYTLSSVIGDENQSIRASWQADSLIVVGEAPGGRFRRAFHEPSGMLVLDNLLVNHLALLARRIARDGFRAETLQVVVPQVGAVFLATIMPEPPGLDGRRTVAVQIASVTELLHLDKDGRLESVEIPSQGILYQRVGAEEERTPPPTPAEEASRSGAVPEEPASPSRILYEEQMIRFVSRGTDLDGILTLPRGGQPIPYPAVLLVHGSGPLDRDETIGPNRPFLELARGLAVYGIASFRYDKRTLAAPQTVDPVRMTVKEEVIDDAVAAFETLRSQGGIDRKALVIVGHSLGGGLAATIARQAEAVAGLVLMAATPRPLDQVLRDQIERIRSRSGPQGLASSEQESLLARTLAQLDSLQAGSLPDDRIVFGMSTRYLLDYRGRDLGAELLAFPGRILFLQGGKDQQITRTDFDLWKQIVEEGDKRDAAFRFFPELGHLFIPIQGEPEPTSLLQPGNVDPGVIAEIAGFVKSLR